MTAWPLPRPWRTALALAAEPRHAYPVTVVERLDAVGPRDCGGPLVLLLIEVLRGAVHDVSLVRTQTLHAELTQLQSRGLQRAKGLQVLIESHDAAAAPWTQTGGQSWFTSFWSELRPGEHGLYAAIVDEAGQIVAHTDSSKIGRRLGSSWYEQKVSDGGPDVVWTQRSSWRTTEKPMT